RVATKACRFRRVSAVFAPDRPGAPGPRIVSAQLIRYAGHEAPEGTVIGDPASTGVTRLARELGWAGGSPRGRFDVLPLLVQEPGRPLPLPHLPAPPPP